jgi:two-component system chemotaxis response regulator CheB
MAQRERSIRRLVVIGGSAGSLDVLFRLLPVLRPDFPHPIVIVLHRRANVDTMLTELLAMKTKLTLSEPEDKDPIQPGWIYLAPGDYHILFEKDGLLSLDYSEKVAYSRPSIDVAFQSAADCYGPNTLGILLSGANADGSEGMGAIRNAGGTTIVQLPQSAEVAFMPQQAISKQVADYILDVEGIAAFLNGMAE